jgi:hypothetical protein
MKIVIKFLLLSLFAIPAFGSVKRIEISKTTQAESPIEFSMKITPDEQQAGHCLVELLLPPGQQELAELWKIDLWVLQDRKTILGVPLDLDYAKDKTITLRFSGHVDTVSRCLVAIRCGKHAPLSETIYQIDVGSYLKNTAEEAATAGPEPTHSGGAQRPPSALIAQMHGVTMLEFRTDRPFREARVVVNGKVVGSQTIPVSDPKTTLKLAAVVSERQKSVTVYLDAQTYGTDVTAIYPRMLDARDEKPQEHYHTEKNIELFETGWIEIYKFSTKRFKGKVMTTYELKVEIQ